MGEKLCTWMFAVTVTVNGDNFLFTNFATARCYLALGGAETDAQGDVALLDVGYRKAF